MAPQENMLLASLPLVQKQVLLVRHGQRGGFGLLSSSSYGSQVQGCPTDTPDLIDPVVCVP